MLLLPIGFAGAGGYDISLAGKDITFDNSPAFIGDTVEITALIKNNGTTAENVAVAFYLGTTLIDSEVKPVVPVTATAKGHWNTTGLAPGTYTIDVKVVAQGDTNASNNNASASIVLKKRPTAVPVIENLVVSPGSIVDGIVAYINGTVKNTGDANATLEAKFLVDNVSIGKSSVVLNFGEPSKIVGFAWNTSGKEGKHTVSMQLGSARKDVQVTVGHRPKATFKVNKIWLSDVQPTEGRSVTVHAEVENTGDAAEEIVVVFKYDTYTFGQSKAMIFTPGEKKNVSANWNAKKGERVIRVEVQDHPEAFNFYTVKPTSLQSNQCGFTIVMPGIAIIGGCAFVAKWRKPGRGKVE